MLGGRPVNGSRGRRQERAVRIAGGLGLPRLPEIIPSSSFGQAAGTEALGARGTMNEKRTFPRWKKRLLVDFEVEGRTASGFTWDISHTGLSISSQYVPKLGEKLQVDPAPSEREEGRLPRDRRPRAPRPAGARGGAGGERLLPRSRRLLRGVRPHFSASLK